MKDLAKGTDLRKSVGNQEKQDGLELSNKVKTQMCTSQSRKIKCVIKDSDHSRSK